jgi:REP element-mobilizing transposase RayT
LEISEKFEINFLEIGNDEDHIHFLMQGIPNMPVSRIVQIIKSITVGEIFCANLALGVPNINR